MLLYRTFVEKSTTVADFAWTSSQIIFNEFRDKLSKYDSFVDLYNVLYGQIRAIFNGSNATSWADLGGVLLDIADMIVSITPIGNAASIVKVLWQIGSLA